jgi:hypothetical protein
MGKVGQGQGKAKGMGEDAGWGRLWVRGRVKGWVKMRDVGG